jgi:hypothetical protein
VAYIANWLLAEGFKIELTLHDCPSEQSIRINNDKNLNISEVSTAKQRWRSAAAETNPTLAWRALNKLIRIKNVLSLLL